MASRIERDALGEIEVPADALWGAQTERARRNFPVSGAPFDRRVIHAIARIKAAAAAENAARGVLDPRLAEAIAAAAREVADGRWDAQFPIDVFQTGSATSSHMNVNEVVANLAIRRLGGVVGSRDPVHPNDHVNLGQSSNDVIPTAVHLAVLAALDRLEAALGVLVASLERRAAALAHVVKLGRTHLMDAVPMRLGDEIGGWAAQLRSAARRVTAARPALCELALGGTAVGTGLNAPEGFAEAVIARLAEETGWPLRQAPDLFEALASRDALVGASAALRAVAIAFAKVANDVRWLASGPRGGLGELRIPDLQPGSSIMPGKVNPVLSEMALMVAADVVGADATVAWAAASGGTLELNVGTPIAGQRVLESATRLANAVVLFAERCVDGLEADEARCRALAEASPALATPLARRVGYDVAAAIAKEAAATGRTIREVCLARGLLPVPELDRLLDLEAMARGRSV